MTLGDRGPFGVVLHLGRVAGLLIWKGSQNRTIIYKGLTVTRFFGRPILGACGSPWMRCCFRQFFVLHSSEVMFISNQDGKWWGWVLPFFVPFQVPVFVCIGSFLLCFACLPWFHLRAGACVGGLVGGVSGVVGGSSLSAFDYLDFSMVSKKIKRKEKRVLNTFSSITPFFNALDMTLSNTTNAGVTMSISLVTFLSFF